jgi:16S rRNA (guanine527-N7)-methyltransferase
MRHATILDLGSGGGFPGLPLAASLPDTRVTLAESVGKKAAFLATVVEALGLIGRVTVAVARSETLPRSRWDLVAARAVGSLAELVELGLPLLSPGGHILAWKRGDLVVELEAASRAAAELGGDVPVFRPHPAGLAAAAGIAGHGIVVIRKTRPTPPGYPRDPAARRRRPW